MATFVGGLDDLDELGAPPGPVAVVDNVGRVDDERSVVSVELARPVTATVDRILECGSRLVGVAAAQWAWPKWSNQRDASECLFLYYCRVC